MADLEAVERRLWSILDGYLERGLVRATIYNLPCVTWPGAKGHEYFAAVKPARRHVGLYLVAADRYPEALEWTPSSLLARRTGKAAFTFPTLDDAMAADLAALLDRLFERYAADHGSRRG